MFSCFALSLMRWMWELKANYADFDVFSKNFYFWQLQTRLFRCSIDSPLCLVLLSSLEDSSSEEKICSGTNRFGGNVWVGGGGGGSVSGGRVIGASVMAGGGLNVVVGLKFFGRLSSFWNVGKLEKAWLTTFWVGLLSDCCLLSACEEEGFFCCLVNPGCCCNGCRLLPLLASSSFFLLFIFSSILSIPSRLFLFLSGAWRISLMSLLTSALQGEGSNSILSSKDNSAVSLSSLEEGWSWLKLL